jgi:Na+/proline symporter
MASCKDERHSILATLWYQLAHYCVRPWPWLIVAFAALAMYPELRASELQNADFDSGVGFPRVIRDLSPPGLRGLLMVTFFAAFMSTISTQMNWGASYLVRDFYQRFMAPGASEAQLTRASRIASVIVLIAGGIAAVLMKERGMSVDGAWKMLAALGAGTGAVFMLRWFWWRINAWSEITSMIASLVFFLLVDPVFEMFGSESPRAEVKMLIVALFTICTWVLVTLLTRPERRDVLDSFYQQVRPGGPGWGPVAKRNADVKVDDDLAVSIIAALFATGIVFFTLPCIGNLIFRHYQVASSCGVGAAVCSVVVAVLVQRLVRRNNMS